MKSIVAIILSIALGVIWILVTWSIGAPGLVRCIGILFIAGGIATGLAMMRSAARHREQRTLITPQTESAQNTPARES